MLNRILDYNLSYVFKVLRCFAITKKNEILYFCLIYILIYSLLKFTFIGDLVVNLIKG